MASGHNVNFETCITKVIVHEHLPRVIRAILVVECLNFGSEHQYASLVSSTPINVSFKILPHNFTIFIFYATSCSTFEKVQQ
jgi:hypothetical protein